MDLDKLKKKLNNQEVKLVFLRKRIGQALEQVDFALEDARCIRRTFEEEKEWKKQRVYFYCFYLW